MKKAVAFFHIAIKDTGFAENFVEACKLVGINLEYHYIGVRGFANRFNALYSHYENIVTWGVRKSNDDYHYKGKNVLFIEFASLPQRYGWFLDADGLYSDSRFCKEKLWNSSEKESVKKLKTHFYKYYDISLFEFKNKNNGYILLTLQNHEDAQIINYYERCENFYCKLIDKLKENIGDRKVLVRPHPKYSDEWKKVEKDIKFPAKWKIDNEKNLYKSLVNCKALVTVNSTTAIEALAFGKSVYTLGDGIFTDSGVTYECNKRNYLEHIDSLINTSIDTDYTLEFLRSLIYHTIPRIPSVSDIVMNNDFILWAMRTRRK